MFRPAFAILIALGISPNACGQDARVYRVAIPNGLTLNALSSTQTSTHPLTATNLNFFNSNWFVNANNGAGANATFTAGPFVNLSDSSFRRDVHLRLRALDNNSIISQIFGIQWPWQYETRNDRTRYASGDNTARVSLNSTFAGSAQVSIRVRFITGDVDSLAAGTYQTTVVGTITAN